MILLCYFAAFWLCASPIIPYQFDSYPLLLIGMVVLGTPLAAMGIYLNHLAEKHSKKS